MMLGLGLAGAEVGVVDVVDVVDVVEAVSGEDEDEVGVSLEVVATVGGTMLLDTTLLEVVLPA